MHLYVCLNPSFFLVSNDSLEQKVGIVGSFQLIHPLLAAYLCVPAQAIHGVELGHWL